MYMMYDGYVFSSANKGTTWTQTSFAQVTADSNDTTRQYGQKIAIDPNNPNIVYVGTPENGLWVSTNGGTTWTKVSAIPASLTYSDGSYPGITGIVFDPAIGGAVGGVTQTIFASSYGNGVYESTNGGASWTHLAGGPTDADYAVVSSTGVYYAVGDSDSSLWSYASGKWTELLTGSGMSGVAIDPSNPSEIVVQYLDGQINISYNGGASWTGVSNDTLTSADIPWLASGSTGSGYTYTTAGGIAFSQTTANQLISTGGTGVWTTSNVPTSSTGSAPSVTWADMSVGIENLQSNEIIVPTSGHPVLASWDRPFFYISDPSSYPSTYGPVDSATMNEGWSIDYASSDPNFVVGIADWYYSGVEESGYSTDGGQTWTDFPSYPAGAGTSFMGGTIAASTPENFIWAPSGGHDPYYTTNGGQTWQTVTLPGVTNYSGFDWAYYLDQRSVTADRVLANTFYLYYPGQGVFKTTDGGSNWTKVYSGTIGPGSDEGYNSTIMSVPGEAGNLFYTGGPQGTITATPAAEPFYRSTDGGATWTAVANVQEVFTFGFGAAASGSSYPTIYIVGYVNNVYGVWQSTNDAQSWTNIGTYPLGNMEEITSISGDPSVYGEVYIGFKGGGYAYLPAGWKPAKPVL
jgi:hypothetical protein